MSLGSTSDGARGVLLGLLVPGACILVIGVLTDLLIALVIGAVATFVGVQFALQIGGTMDGDIDPVILTPFLSAAAVACGAVLGALWQLLAGQTRQRRVRTHERPRSS
jgi:hypothetical protein